ncbi:MAG: gliding motility-associated C-terminal domain-containing protein, partial [Flavobacteriales bacterium]
IEVTDPCNETAVDTIWVFANQYDSIVITTDDHLICPGTLIDLTSQISGGTGDFTYTWSGDGDIQNGTSSSATVIPPNEGTYTLEVEDNCGNKGIGEIEVQFDDCEITIPNVFTPNGDGLNEYFYIVNLDKHPQSKLVIYNRWGEKIYESTDYQNDWDGDNHPDGTYYWILNMLDGSDDHGYITIIR